MTAPTPTTPTPSTPTPTPPTSSAERADLLETLGKHRFFLRFTARDLSDEQAALRSTVSRLCVGGIIKHVARAEQGWADFAAGRAGAMSEGSPEEHARSFEMLPGETLAGILAEYEEIAATTDALVAVMDLDAVHPLPEAPWFPPGAQWSNRRVLLHIVAETAQHAGHADIVREGIDGALSMG